VGTPGHFNRTGRRRDFSVEPPHETLLDRLFQKKIPVIGVGKIEDIFASRGVSRGIHTQSDMEGVDQTLKVLGELEQGLIFTNLVDFDTLYGHRNDVQGYASALRQFDERLPEVFRSLRDGDLLILSADHGNDPTTPSTDHSREYVPLLVNGPSVCQPVDLGTRSTFADLGQTLAEIFDVERLSAGASFLSDLIHVH
jgi:phosphopentomutase